MSMRTTTSRNIVPVSYMPMISNDSPPIFKLSPTLRGLPVLRSGYSRASFVEMTIRFFSWSSGWRNRPPSGPLTIALGKTALLSPWCAGMSCPEMTGMSRIERAAWLVPPLVTPEMALPKKV